MSELDSKEKKCKSRKRKIIGLVSVLILVLVVGVSYSLWQIVLKQADSNTITTSCLKVNITEDTDAISLQEAYPLSDEEGHKLVPFKFTIENVCDASTFYVVNLETLNGSGKVLPNNYVKASMFKDTQEVFYDILRSEYENQNKVLSDAEKAYMMYQGRLYNKSSVSFDLRLWLSVDTPLIDSTSDATFQAKITVTSEYIEPVREKNLMEALQLGENSDGRTYYNVSYTQNKKYTVTTVSFESVLNPYDDAVEVIDFSEAQNKSVLGYYVKNEGADTYTLHIQADGKIKANEVASYYGMVNNVVGLENLDTSLTKDMSFMFMNNNNQALDLSMLDTSNVENMMGMFYKFSGKTVDFTNFNTSKVTDMSALFYYSRVENVNMNHFDTSNVSDMSSMFVQCSNLKEIDLSNWQTPNLKNISYMFGWASYLTSVKLDNFDTSKVTDMSYMFVWTWRLQSLDLSSFDTSSVTDFHSMLYQTTTNVTYSEKFVYNNSANVENMFDKGSTINKPSHSSWEEVLKQFSY